MAEEIGAVAVGADTVAIAAGKGIGKRRCRWREQRKEIHAWSRGAREDVEKSDTSHLGMWSVRGGRESRRLLENISKDLGCRFAGGNETGEGGL